MARAAEKRTAGNGGAPATPPDVVAPPSGKTANVAKAVQDSDSVWLPHAELKRWESNPRDNEANVPRVAASIERFGFVNPIVVWRKAGRMVAGDTRLLAFRLLLEQHGPGFTAKGAPGPGLVRVVFHDFASEEEADLYALADNRLNELSDWDGKRLDEVLARYDDEDRAIAGFEPEKVEASELEVHAVDIEALERVTFWISVRGPLPAQPDVLDALREHLSGIDGVEVQIGTG